MFMSAEYQQVWKRFRQNRPAVIGGTFIVLAFICAVFAYPLALDKTRDANMQLGALALAQPGARALALKLPLPQAGENPDQLTSFFNGETPRYRLIVLEPGSWQVRPDSVAYRPAGNPDRLEILHKVQCLYAVRDSVIRTEDRYHFSTSEGKAMVLTQQAADALLGTVLTPLYFPLGTDKYGRCMYSRLILGFRVSLLVGGIAVLISLVIGITLGVLGGYFGGKTDDMVMLLINTIWSIPTLLLVFAIVLALGRGIGIIFLAVGMTMWVDVARLVRGQAMTLRSQSFVEAAKSMGLGHKQVIFRHILPNLMGPVVVVAAGNFATAILVESGLSYLGFGVQPPAPSWGGMLHENYGYALSGKPLLALAPAFAIAITVLAFNLLGNGLRDAFDVKSQR